MMSLLQRRPLWLQYVVVFLSMALAWAVRAALDPYLGIQSPFLAFLIAITISAWYGGLFPGLLATVLGTFLGSEFQRTIPGIDLPGVADIWVQRGLFLLNGGIISVLSEAMLSARRRAEENLLSFRKAAEETQTLMDIVPVAILVAHDPECRRITGNPASEEILRLGPRQNASLTGPEPERPHHFRVMRDGREIPPEELPMQIAARTGQEVRAEVFDVVFSDGVTKRLYEYACPLYDGSRRIRGSVGVFVDITDRMRMEEDLRRSAADLRRANDAKDEYLAMLAHELRNPLASISNVAEIIRLEMGVSPKMERARSIMDRQIRHMVRMVNDLLDASRITRGQITLQRSVVEMAAIIRATVETMSPVLQERNHDLVLDLCPEPVYVDGDPVRLEQALTNLLGNAAKYTGRSGRIRLAMTRDADTVRISIKDNGIGIDPDFLPYVFDLFSQADRSLDRSWGGLGIGLTLAHRVVGLHGGSLTAHSDGPGRGSEFVVALPVAEPPPAIDFGRAERAGTAGALRVLLVEDNADTVETMSTVLAIWNHDLRVATTGQEALCVAEEFMPDVVLLDIGLPGMDGFEVARRLRAMERLRNTRIIALTGYTPRDGDDSEAHFDVHLVKPIDLKELQAILTTRNGSGQ